MGEKEKLIVIISSAHSARLANIGTATCDICKACNICEGYGIEDIVEIAHHIKTEQSQGRILVIVDYKSNEGSFDYQWMEKTHTSLEPVKKAFGSLDVSVAILAQHGLSSKEKEMHISGGDVYVPVADGEKSLKEVVRNIVLLWMRKMKPFVLTSTS